MTTSLSKLHEQALNKYRSVSARLDKHKAVIGETTTRIVATVETALGGASAAAIDHYMGESSTPGTLPEATIGPVPVVLAASLALTVGSIAMQKEPWARDVANFANGLGAAGAYAETLRFLQALPAAAPSA